MMQIVWLRMMLAVIDFETVANWFIVLGYDLRNVIHQALIP